MCFGLFKKLAIRLNIFGRPSSILTKADVCFTYIFIIIMSVIISIYSSRYYKKAEDEMILCRKEKDIIVCVKDEVVHIIVPFIGILYGFINTSYKFTSIVSSSINWICCCLYCCKVNSNTPQVNLEMNRVITVP